MKAKYYIVYICSIDNVFNKTILFTGKNCIDQAEKKFIQLFKKYHLSYNKRDIDNCLNDGYFQYNDLTICINEPEVIKANCII